MKKKPIVKCVVTLQCVVCVCLSLACNLSLIWGGVFFYFVLSNTRVVGHFSSYTMCISVSSNSLPVRSGLGFWVIGINRTGLVASGSTYEKPHQCRFCSIYLLRKSRPTFIGLIVFWEDMDDIA